jgi:hypothetical protein
MAERANYVKTGNSAFTRWGNRLSVIPVIGGAIATPLFIIGLVIDSGKWLIRGKVGSAATEFATGVASAAVNVAGSFSLGGLVWWMGKAISPIATEHTLGTHARAGVESLITSATGALGMKPTVLQSYPAGIGALPGAAVYYQQQSPGYWATRAAQEQGKNPNERWQQYRNGDGRDHVAALQNAAQQPQMRGM